MRSRALPDDVVVTVSRGRTSGASNAGPPVLQRRGDAADSALKVRRPPPLAMPIVPPAVARLVRWRRGPAGPKTTTAETAVFRMDTSVGGRVSETRH